MKTYKYIFDPETLTYKKIECSGTKRFIKKVLGHVFIALIGTFLLFLTGSSIISTPKEIILQKEIDKLYTLIDYKLNSVEKNIAELQDKDETIYRTIFEAEPISEEVRNGGTGGNNPYESLENFDHTNLLVATAKRIDNLNARMQVQKQSYIELIKIAQERQNRIASIPAIQPVASKMLNHAPYGFGPRIDPVYKTPAFHHGMDFSAATGTEIYATGNGTVTKANFNKHGYGYHVRIDHGYGYSTLYAHMHKILIKKGEKVKRGQLIGLVGNTGKSVGPHLHYEVRINDKAVDPVNYFYNDLTPEQFEELVKLAKTSNTKLD